MHGRHPQRAFTMLELLLVMGIFAIFAAVAAIELVGFQRGAALEGTQKDIVSALRLAHTRALFGEDGDSNGSGDAWGIRFSNNTNDTYQTFFGSSYNAGNVKETVYVPTGVTFSAPSEGTNTDIVFTKLTGTTTQQFAVSVTDGIQTKTVTIDTNGRVSAN